MKKRHLIILILIILISFVCFLQGCSSGQTDASESYEAVDVEFSREAGAWPNGSFVLRLSAPKGYTIFYTLDGSVPDNNSTQYRTGIRIKGNGNNWLTEEIIKEINVDQFFSMDISEWFRDAWIVRAVAYAPDGTCGDVVTKTYFPGMSLTDEFGDAMVISIITDPVNLFDYETGILVKGKCYDDWIGTEESERILQANNYWDISANFTQSGKEWERPASVEIFDGSDTASLQQDCGIRIHGGIARSFPHRTFRLYFKEKYGEEYLNYPLFPENISEISGDVISRYDCVVLRNGGNMADSLVYKDGWQQALLNDRSFCTQNCRPAVIYLNGEYWGVCAVNDRYNEQYIRDHYGIEDMLVIKEDELSDGNEENLYLYDELKAFFDKDLSDPEIWERFAGTVDVENLVDYYAAQIYIANYDCRIDKNTEMWRSVDTDESNPYADGRWRFMMYDTESGSGCYGFEETAYDFNSLDYLADNNQILKAALENEGFRRMLFDAIAEIGSVNYEYGRVEETIDMWDMTWRRLIDQQNSRFIPHRVWPDEEMDTIKEFYAERYKYLIPIAEEELLTDMPQVSGS